MYLSSHKTGSSHKAGPGVDPDMSFFGRMLAFLRRSIVWIVGILFAALATIGTFFFAIAAIIGTFILAAAIAFAWFLFKLVGNKGFSQNGFPRKDFDPKGPTTLDAKRGPKGWTVNGNDPFGR